MHPLSALSASPNQLPCWNTPTDPPCPLLLPACLPYISFCPHSFLKNIQFTKPGLSLGSANITLPMLRPEIALKLAQLGFNIPTAEFGLKKANLSAAVPMPDLSMATKAINLTLPVPDLGSKQVGLNLTIPDIQFPRLELNVSGMPKVRIGRDTWLFPAVSTLLGRVQYRGRRDCLYEGGCLQTRKRGLEQSILHTVMVAAVLSALQQRACSYD